MPSRNEALEQDIIDQFSGLQVAKLEGDVVKKCILLCTQLNLTPEELTEEWEAFSFNQKLPVDNPTTKALDKFEIFKLKQKQFTKYNAPFVVGKKRRAIDRDEEMEETDSSVDEHVNPSVTLLSSSPQRKAPKKATPEDKEEEAKAESMKKQSGKVIVSFNDTLVPADAPTCECVISFPYDDQELEQENAAMRYMYDPLLKRSQESEQIADKLRERLEFELLAENSVKVDLYDQKVALLCTDRLEPFHLFLQTPVISTARIGKEKLSQDGAVKLFLESAHAGIPVRTEMNLDRLLSYSTFPGQVVAVKGANPTSKLFRLNAMRAPAILPSFPLTSSEYGIQIFSACGPFAGQNISMNLQPLDFLLTQVREKKPDILFLNGPFVDQRQVEGNGGLIQHHGTDYTAEQWFRLQIDMIIEVVNSLHTIVFVLPSQSDIQHPFAMYPQPRYQFNHPALGKKLFFLNDPSTIRLPNGVTVGSTSADILVHLAGEEVVKRPPASTSGSYDRISVLLSHLLQQGSYYPLYPPAESVCLDSQNMDKLQMKQNAPNILITPSDFVPFVKQIGGTLCINPGKVSKGLNGTFSQITMNPYTEGKLLEQTRVDILTI